MGKFDNVQKRLQDAIEELLQKKNMQKIGEIAADMIRLRTRLGYGVDHDGGEKHPLKKLSTDYKKQRKKFSGLHDLTSPSKSNLTRTGQMLDSLGVTSAQKGKVKVGPKGSRDDGKTNSKIAEYVTKQGRAFNNLSGTEKKRLSESIAKEIKKLFQKNLTKR